jgi:RpiR family transcriptional regulator, carbohydrate utilization regulator
MSDGGLSAEAVSPIAAGIRSRLPELSPVECRVAQTILEQGDRLLYQSASEVASLAGAALSTVVRTCQTLGFKGFQDLKLSLAREGRPVTAEEIQGEVHLGDSPAVVLAKLRDGAREAVDLGIAHVDRDAFTAAVSAISRARRVLCLGVGTSAPLAQDVAYRLLWVGIDADAPADPHVQHVRATVLEPEDLALVVSHTGSTRETVAAARAASTAGATVVAVSSFPRSPLAESADITLIAATRETSYRVEALASRIAHLVVLDALWVAIAVQAGDAALGLARRINDVISDHRF